MAKKVIREEIDIFGGAREKGATKKDTKSDKPTVEVKGLEEKLLSMEYLKSEIADLEGQLKTVTDEIKEVSKEKYIELYEQAGRNPNTFIIRDGNGCVMVLPTDRYIKVADRARAEELQERYGEDAVEIEEKFVFDNDVLQRNLATIQSLIANSSLSDSDKRALVYKEVKFNVAKGFIDRINEFEDMEGVLNDVQPVIALKNCGGKMEEGGEMADNYIGFVYDEYASGGGVDGVETLGKNKYKYRDFEFEVEEGELNMTSPEFYEGQEIEGSKPSLSEIKSVIADYFDFANRDIEKFPITKDELKTINKNFSEKEQKEIFGMTFSKYSKGGSIDTDYNPEWAEMEAYSPYISRSEYDGMSEVEELQRAAKKFSKSAEVLVRENLKDGEICECKLKKILGREPNYPNQVVGSIKLEKAYLRPYYKLA